jgi:hypothetical protein
MFFYETGSRITIELPLRRTLQRSGSLLSIVQPPRQISTCLLPLCLLFVIAMLPSSAQAVEQSVLAVVGKGKQYGILPQPLKEPSTNPFINQLQECQIPAFSNT